MGNITVFHSFDEIAKYVGFYWLKPEKTLYTFKCDLGYRNELTIFLDRFLICQVKSFYTHINDLDTNVLPLRFPGRTWGHIKIDKEPSHTRDFSRERFHKNKIITEIQIDTLGHGMGSIYRPEAQQAVQQYIGYKIVTEDDNL